MFWKSVKQNICSLPPCAWLLNLIYGDNPWNESCANAGLPFPQLDVLLSTCYTCSLCCLIFKSRWIVQKDELYILCGFSRHARVTQFWRSFLQFYFKLFFTVYSIAGIVLHGPWIGSHVLLYVMIDNYTVEKQKKKTEWCDNTTMHALQAPGCEA